MRTAERSVLEALCEATRLGVPDQLTDQAWAWTRRKVAVTFTADAGRRMRSNGWDVVAGLGSFTELVAGLGRVSKVPLTVPQAVGACCRWWGVEPPAKGVWLEAKVVVELPGRSADKLRRDGWMVVSLDGSWRSAAAALHTGAMAVAAHVGAADAVNPSKVEQELVLALSRSGCPPIRRDVEIHDPDTGVLLSRPDIAWPTVKLAVELDGWWWHSGQTLDVILGCDDAESARAALVHADRSRFERDARKRRRLAALGWTVVSVVDTEMRRGNVTEIAAEVAAVYRRCAR